MNAASSCSAPAAILSMSARCAGSISPARMMPSASSNSWRAPLKGARSRASALWASMIGPQAVWVDVVDNQAHNIAVHGVNVTALDEFLSNVIPR